MMVYDSHDDVRRQIIGQLLWMMRVDKPNRVDPTPIVQRWWKRQVKRIHHKFCLWVCCSEYARGPARALQNLERYGAGDAV
jgi:hypothetical protein